MEPKIHREHRFVMWFSHQRIETIDLRKAILGASLTEQSFINQFKKTSILLALHWASDSPQKNTPG
jgi:hypothetical protein